MQPEFPTKWFCTNLCCFACLQTTSHFASTSISPSSWGKVHTAPTRCSNISLISFILSRSIHKVVSLHIHLSRLGGIIPGNHYCLLLQTSTAMQSSTSLVLHLKSKQLHDLNALSFSISQVHGGLDLITIVESRRKLFWVSIPPFTDELSIKQARASTNDLSSTVSPFPWLPSFNEI